MKILIITQSSTNGLNHRQAMECMNVLGSQHTYEIKMDPRYVENEQIKSTDRIIMIVPEWNGSFPFSFKELIDSSGWPSRLKDKKILLIGTSNTTFGNLMGISHLRYILEYVGAEVYPKLLCVPHIQDKFANNNIDVDARLNENIIKFCS